MNPAHSMISVMVRSAEAVIWPYSLTFPWRALAKPRVARFAVWVPRCFSVGLSCSSDVRLQVHAASSTPLLCLDISPLTAGNGFRWDIEG